MSCLDDMRDEMQTFNFELEDGATASRGKYGEPKEYEIVKIKLTGYWDNDIVVVVKPVKQDGE